MVVVSRRCAASLVVATTTSIVVIVATVASVTAIIIVVTVVTIVTLARVVTTSALVIAIAVIAMATAFAVAIEAALTAASMRVVSLRMRVVHQRPVCILHGDVFRGTSLRILTHFVTDLASSASAAELPLRLKAVVPVDSDDPSIEIGSVESTHCEGSFLASGILDEAEAARLLHDSIESHDQVDDLATG